jgi:serine/threonine protein kinase
METEDMTRYVSGGYHPIGIGDVLGPTSERSYRIVHKLGYGSYATVWLAQKTASSNSFVAIKVTTAESDRGGWRESVMLEIACSGDTASHMLTLLDHFTLHGPNGTHFELVTEVLIPFLPTLGSKPTPLWRKCAARNLAEALAQLHSKNIVHGGMYAAVVDHRAHTISRSPPGERRTCLPTDFRPGSIRRHSRPKPA